MAKYVIIRLGVIEENFQSSPRKKDVVHLRYKTRIGNKKVMKKYEKAKFKTHLS